MTDHTLSAAAQVYAGYAPSHPAAVCGHGTLSIRRPTPSALPADPGTALHHAVWSGSLDAVSVLVEAGADLNRRDTIYDATPLGWAKYGEQETKDKSRAKQYAEIAAYLVEKGG